MYTVQKFTLFSLISSIFACGPGLSGLDGAVYTVTLSPVYPPIAFTYSPIGGNIGFSNAASEGEAIRAIETFTQNIILQQMKQYIPAVLMLPASMVNSILDEFEVKLSTTYTPLACAAYFSVGYTTPPAGNTNQQAVTVPPYANRNGDYCLYTSDQIITQYCKNQTGASPTCPTGAELIPRQYTIATFTVDPGTGVLSNQNRRFWNNFMDEVLQALKMSTYGPAFTTTSYSISKTY